MRQQVGPLQILDATRNVALERCIDLVRSGAGGRVVTANLDFLALARRDPALAANLNAATMVVADGAPVAWLARLAGARSLQRLAGVDLVRDLCLRATADAPMRIAIYGSSPEIGGPAARVLEQLSPHATVVRALHPPFRQLSEQERGQDLAALRASEPNLVLVALGCPAQEETVAEWLPSIPGALWIGVGGTLDFFAGRRKRAPRWVQRAGLEWVVRLVQEPRRLAGRYLARDLPALLALAPRCLAARRGDASRVLH